MSRASLEVLAPGLLTTVQDARGRAEYGRLGVPAGGAMDAPSARAANLLVGNLPDAAVLEATFSGPTLQVQGASVVVAVTGADFSVTMDGLPLEPGVGVLARAGSVVAFGERRAGARAYLAVSGGIDVPFVLGSRSTAPGAAFGGFEGRPLACGDRLPVGSSEALVAGRYLAHGWTPPSTNVSVRVLPGPHLDRFQTGVLDALCGGDWQVSHAADRMGYRLSGENRLRHTRGADVASLGLPPGAIQVPGDGLPIILLADHQPTGGYTVVACVIRADLPVLAQRGPGDPVRFVLTTPEGAARAILEREAWLQVAGGEGEAAAGWAGA